MGYCTTWVTGKTKRECRAKMAASVRAGEKVFGYRPGVSKLRWVREVRARFELMRVVVEKDWKLFFHLDK